MPLRLLFLLVGTSLSACSQFNLPRWGKAPEQINLKDWKAYGPVDYSHHIASYEQMYLNADGTNELPLQSRSREYLEDLIYTILQNNELFFEHGAKPRVHVVKSALPFHFSLPSRVIFLSTALVNKYIKHEAVLASILSYELIRSEKELYNRTLIVPVGYLSIERVLGLNKIDVVDKVEIHKWAYHAVRRAGFDGEYYLSWLQTMNRNTADFIPLLGDAGNISQEEALFKAFMIRRSKSEDERTLARRDSSKEFYQFLFYVKDTSL